MTQNRELSGQSNEQEVYTMLTGNIRRIMYDHRVPPYLVLDTAHKTFTPKHSIEFDLEEFSRTYGIPLKFDPENKATKDSLQKFRGQEQAEMRTDIQLTKQKLREITGGRIFMIVCGVIDADTNTSFVRGKMATLGSSVRYQIIDQADLNRPPGELLGLSNSLYFLKSDQTLIDRYLFARALIIGKLPAGIDNLTSPYSLYEIWKGDIDPRAVPASV
jgi:hypothetical protein